MKNLKNILKKLIFICTPSVMLSLSGIKTNSSPLKRANSLPNLKLYTGDMLGESSRKRELKVPCKFLTTSASLPNLNNIDEFERLRYELRYTDLAYALHEGRFPNNMTNILMDGNFFMNIYIGFTSPTNHD